jgi:hypothetical protein
MIQRGIGARWSTETSKRVRKCTVKQSRSSFNVDFDSLAVQLEKCLNFKRTRKIATKKMRFSEPMNVNYFVFYASLSDIGKGIRQALLQIESPNLLYLFDSSSLPIIERVAGRHLLIFTNSQPKLHYTKTKEDRKKMVNKVRYSYFNITRI